MEKIHPFTVYGSCHLEVSGHMYIVLKTTFPNMIEKQQGQISRNLSSTRNSYFRGQDQTPRKFILKDQNLSRPNSITTWKSAEYH